MSLSLKEYKQFKGKTEYKGKADLCNFIGKNDNIQPVDKVHMWERFRQTVCSSVLPTTGELRAGDKTSLQNKLTEVTYNG